MRGVEPSQTAIFSAAFRAAHAHVYAGPAIHDDTFALQFSGFEDAEQLRHRASGLFLRCMGYGLKMLPGKWKDAVNGDLATFKKLVDKAGKSKIKGMFWTGLGLASAINMNRDNIEMVAHLPKAKALVERVVALDPNYQNGMALIALGMMNSAQGKALGGKPEEGRKFFERASAASDGKFLMAKVLQARTYAVITQNRELFRKLLLDVLTTDPAIWPEQRLANALAQHKARRYLKQEKDWF